MKPRTAPVKPIEKVIEKQPDIASAVSTAIIEVGKTADENARMMREAIMQILESKKEPVKQWRFKIIGETDKGSARYGLAKEIIATAD